MPQNKCITYIYICMLIIFVFLGILHNALYITAAEVLISCVHHVTRITSVNEIQHNKERIP